MRKLLLLILLAVSAVGAQKTVHVRTYTRKDGTVVHAHPRSAPGNAAAATAAPKAKTTTGHSALKSSTPVPPVARTSNGRIARSATAKRQFEAAHPCPATGRTTAGCPGYIIDHKTALACGGADSPSNMQWQSVAAAKEKDRWERVGCAVGR